MTKWVSYRKMKMHGQSSLMINFLRKRKSLNRWYHIRPDCFRPYSDLWSLTQWVLLGVLSLFSKPAGVRMYISLSTLPYKYAVTTSINLIFNCSLTVRLIKYLKVMESMTGEYVASKSTPGLCENPCATRRIVNGRKSRLKTPTEYRRTHGDHETDRVTTYEERKLRSKEREKSEENGVP